MPPANKLQPGVDLLLVGVSDEIEFLRFDLYDHPSVRRVEEVPYPNEAWEQVRSRSVGALVFDLRPCDHDVDLIALTVLRMRAEYPDLVFAFLSDDDEFRSTLATLPPDVRTRLGHYHRLSRARPPREIDKMIAFFGRWQEKVRRTGASRPRYVYDVALSFAGEDRAYADELATLLRQSGARVFYDNFEQAKLWGTNLIDHLFDVYAVQSRYCIMLVSTSYATKLWTGHERSAAQQRALESRDVEYLLPVRIDETRLPGLPHTVGYLDIKMGIPKIARHFLEKLSSAMARDRGSEVRLQPGVATDEATGD